MCELCRCIVFSVVGWLSLLGAAASAQEASREQPVESQSIADSLQRIASSVENSEAPSEVMQPCPRGTDNRSSDICAQWKAADSAHDAAWWGGATFYVGLVGLLLGAITMGAAIAAALYAKRAAVATERAAEIAKLAAAGADQALEIATRNADAAVSLVQNQIALERGRLVVGHTDCKYSLSREVDLHLAVSNFGKTPVILRGYVSESTGGPNFDGLEGIPLTLVSNIIPPQSNGELTNIASVHGFGDHGIFGYIIGYVEYDLIFTPDDSDVEPRRSYFGFKLKELPHPPFDPVYDEIGHPPLEATPLARHLMPKDT